MLDNKIIMKNTHNKKGCKCPKGVDEKFCLSYEQERKEFYAGKSKKDWIKWAESEIKEYKSFLKFLKEI